MSKIYAIKCPQCGSPEKSVVKENFYKCESCGTEYFVESNDVRHFHFHRSEQEISKPSYFNWIKISILALILFVATISLFVSDNKKQQGVTYSNRPKNTTIKKDIPKERLVLSHYSYYALNRNNEPILIGIGEVKVDHWAKNKNVFDIIFYNAKTGRVSPIQQMNKQANSIHSDIKIVKFRTGEIYAINSERKAYLIDLESEQFISMNEEFERRHKTLSKGIAKIEKSRRYGDGFEIMLVDGKQVLYFPNSNYLTTNDEAFDYIYRTKGKIANNAVLNTALAFTGYTMDKNIDNKIRLIEYQTKTAEGYPFNTPSFYDPFEKNKNGGDTFLSKTAINEARITKWRDVTPEREYYLPELSCSNKQYALISFNQNVLSDSSRFFQLLDIQTGNPIWTKEFKPNQSIRSCVIDNTGTSYIFERYANSKVYQVDLQGNESGEKIWE